MIQNQNMGLMQPLSSNSTNLSPPAPDMLQSSDSQADAKAQQKLQDIRNALFNGQKQVGSQAGHSSTDVVNSYDEKSNKIVFGASARKLSQP